MEPVLQFIGAREDLKSLDTCGCDHRRDRIGEEVWTTALTQQVDDLFLTRRETAYRTAKGFAERSGDDLYFSAHVIQFGDAVSGFADHACRVRLIDHDKGVVLLRQFVDLIKRTDVAIHGEDTVGSDDTETLRLRFLQLLLEVGHVSVGIAVTHGFAQTHAVDDRGVVECIGDDRILFGEQRFEQTSVGIKARSIEDGIFRAEEVGDDALELLVGILRTADETYRRHAVAASVHAVFGGLDQFGVVGKTEVVVGTEVDNLLSAFYGNAGRLRRDDHTLVLI